MSKKKHIEIQELLFFILLTVGEVFFLYYNNDILTLSISRYKLSALLFIFIAFDLYVAYLLHKISYAYKLKTELSLVKQQSELQLQAYEALANKYSLSRQTIHDMKKHLSTLQSLIDKKQLNTAEKYTKLLNTQLDNFMPVFTCDNDILSVIINSKLIQAHKNNINFVLDVQYSLLDFISKIDITAIFANILDNAFEACIECAEQNRLVRLSVLRHNNFLLIYVKNSFIQVESLASGKYKSTKLGHQGIGLTNVYSVTQKYDGVFSTKIIDNTFISEITLCIPS